MSEQGDIIFRAAAANTIGVLAHGAAGEALLSGGHGADPSWGAPAPAAHVLDTTGPHTGTLLLTDLEVGVQGNIIHRGAADWEALAVGAVGQALISGGAGANVSWGVPGGEIFVKVTDPDGNLGDHPVVVLTDAVDTTIRFQLKVPPGFSSIVAAQVIVVQTATGGAPNMQWSTTTDFGGICLNEAYNLHSDAETDQVTALTQNDFECVDISGSLTGIAANDLVGITFIRRGTQGGDVVNADVYYCGFRFQYV